MTQIRSIQIREGGAQDSAAIAELSRELGYQTTSGDVAPRLAFLLGSEDHGIFIAEENSGRMVGWIHVFSGFRLMADSFGDLGGLVVAKAFRSQGIGAQLLRAAEEWALSKGMKALRIRSRDTRLEAHRFYESKGYKALKSQVVLERSLT